MADAHLTINQRIEFGKGALALLPGAGDVSGPVAFKVVPVKPAVAYGFCTCQGQGGGKKKNGKHCEHLVELDRVDQSLGERGGIGLYDALRRSVWDMLAGILNEAHRLSRDKIRVVETREGQDRICLDFFDADTRVARYAAGAESAGRLLSRLDLSPGTDQFSRRVILDRLARLSLSDAERVMMDKGHRTRRQVLEQSFWFTFCYHLFFDWGFVDGRLCAAIDDADGAFFIRQARPDATVRFCLYLPRPAVPHALLSLRSTLENGDVFAVSETRLISILNMRLTHQNDLRMELWFRYRPEGEEERVYARESLVPFTYGDLIYLKDMGHFARVESPDPLFDTFKGAYVRTIRRDRLPHHIDSMGEAFWTRSSDHIIDDGLKNIRIFKQQDRVHIVSDTLDRNWFYLSVAYGFGESRVSLADIVRARKEGRRFIPVDQGWVDSRAVDIDAYAGIPGLSAVNLLRESDDPVALSTADLFRVMAAAGAVPELSGLEKQKLEGFLSMRPTNPPEAVAGLRSTLRPYQLTGVHWLMFLYDHQLGGLLCDDMGLGKTHQVMALMVWLKQVRTVDSPFLVVAPVTVLSHWERKLAEHAPDLSVAVHHGSDRDVGTLGGRDVVLTSYGVLRRDSFTAVFRRFSLAVFDEAQHVKNSKTKAYQAALAIPAAMKLCVTGTPLENSIVDLKALMDLAFPDYLGSDEAFDFRYVKPVMMDNNRQRREELARLVSPFTLRRMKATVLDELPAKIEDIRTCRLSEDQLRLYRQTVADKGGEIRRLLDRSDTIPYIHVFAVLTLLKQICNHPALALKTPDRAADYASGKWDLFVELLDEALASGQKIVVYSQYVDMLRIIESHLDEKKVGRVSLTGASRNRGELIRRFNEDPDCRVFAGSLLAGGSGIDLVGASVVIHYDRWWNAAKEEQATDRVHRIGQTRGVQVFKLVTEGTLEEKISAIIEKKKNLMDAVIREDDPDLFKAFSREQILDLLSFSG